MLKNDFILSFWFHKSAYVENNDDSDSDSPCSQKKSSSASDDVHKKIYVKTTLTI